jgi:hypothetical protein
MKITRTSPFSGDKNTMDIDVTRAQIVEWEAGELIQHAMPNLTAAEREFIMTGATAEDWETMSGSNE